MNVLCEKKKNHNIKMPTRFYKKKKKYFFSFLGNVLIGGISHTNNNYYSNFL